MIKILFAQGKYFGDIASNRSSLKFHADSDFKKILLKKIAFKAWVEEILSNSFPVVPIGVVFVKQCIGFLAQIHNHWS